MDPRLRIRRTVLGILLLAGFTAPGCLLTNELGLPSPGAVSGGELQDRVRESALLAFSLSLKGYCNRFSGGDSTCDNEVGDGERKAQAYLHLLLPDFAGIDVGTFYTARSAADCEAEILLGTLLLPGLYLQEQERRTTTGSITLRKPADLVVDAAVFTAFMTGDACAAVLDETGPLLYVGAADWNF